VNRRLPDLDSVTGVLDSVAPPVDERAEREVIKNAVTDLDLDYGPRRDAELIGPGGNSITQGRMQYVQALVNQNRTATVNVPVSYGPAGKAVHDHVRVSRVGDGIWVEGSTEGIKSMIMARNPLLQLGVAPEPVDAKVRLLTEEQAGQEYARRHAQWGG
jgi:hypothetical protein